jgi:hypothetical protein
VKNIIFYFTICFGLAAYADSEKWQLKECHRFGVIESALRNQGLATDGHGTFWFSSTQGLLRTNSKWGDAKELHVFPIPHELSKFGDNHVGDIDFANGKIYASIEDGPKYLNPYVGIYDAKTLKFEKAFRLPVPTQNDGVPWVAADASTGHVYSSEFARPNIINVYSMKDMSPLSPIHLNQALPRVQGAKIFNKSMYITADGEGADIKAVYKADLSNGEVSAVAEIPNEIGELEGLAFLETKNGAELYVLGNLRDRAQEGLPSARGLRKSELCTYIKGTFNVQN